MPATRISERFQTRVGLRPGRAAARHEMMFFLRRIALLVGSVAAARARRRGGAGRIRGCLLLARRHVGARHGRHDRLDPQPGDPRRRDHQGRPDDLRRGYDVLRPGHPDGAVRRRGPLWTARRTPHAEQDRPAQGPLPDLRVRTRRPPGRQGPARRGRAVRGDRRQPRRARVRRGGGRAAGRGAGLRRPDDAGGGHRAGMRGGGVRRLRRGEHLRDPDRARTAPRHPDRGARGGRVVGAQADPGRRERGRLALQGERAHDGEPGARGAAARPARGTCGKRSPATARRPRPPPRDAPSSDTGAAPAGPVERLRGVVDGGRRRDARWRSEAPPPDARAAAAGGVRRLLDERRDAARTGAEGAAARDRGAGRGASSEPAWAWSSSAPRSRARASSTCSCPTRGSGTRSRACASRATGSPPVCCRLPSASGCWSSS